MVLILKKSVENSRVIVDLNKADVTIVESDMFNSLSSKYELFFFNIPYIPSQQGIKMGIIKNLGLGNNKAWDGVPDGLNVMRK